MEIWAMNDDTPRKTTQPIYAKKKKKRVNIQKNMQEKYQEYLNLLNKSILSRREARLL